ncbi:MAG: hypothetical protein J1F42_01745 [Lachnospiraceae bacterium]|nr:hypothetical protein [Lachnospiraceae bacterium]
MPTKRYTNDTRQSKSVNNSERKERGYQHYYLEHSAIKRNNEKAVNNPVPGDEGNNNNGSAN